MRRPVLARAELVLALDRAAAALLDQAHEHPGALGLDDEGDGLLVVRVEVPVDRVGVDEGQVAGLPVVALVVVDLVAGALEDVEGGLVLVAVAVVGALRRQLDEVHLQRLGEELLVAGADAPPGARLLGVAGVPDLGVVDDDRVVADPLHARAAPCGTAPSPYVSEVSPRTKTRPFLPMRSPVPRPHGPDGAVPLGGSRWCTGRRERALPRRTARVRGAPAGAPVAGGRRDGRHGRGDAAYGNSEAGNCHTITPRRPSWRTSTRSRTTTSCRPPPAPVDTPPVPGAPPGLDEDGPAGEPPVSPAVMAPG